ncbi:MAG: type 1 glutamine amidotransferase [Noviherbaspirillum sp.]|jgi:protease I|nr:type 1 glutamine amidotransferase [Noviherbaspirillum sp.]MDB5794603.1 type 1 glutamine amidotransferase [Noviherbaspirillum sp.]
MEQSSQQEMALGGMHVAILVTDGFEQAEFTEPKKALEEVGAITKVISDKHGKVQGFNHDAKADQFDVDLTFDEADPQDYDAVLLPGGVFNADQIRINLEAQRIVRGIAEARKPIAVICHGPWLLISAGLVNNRTLTSWPTLQDDIRNAGAKWVNEEVVVDGDWISSRKPADIPAFNRKMIEVMTENRNQHVHGTADENAVGIASS